MAESECAERIQAIAILVEAGSETQRMRECETEPMRGERGTRRRRRPEACQALQTRKSPIMSAGTWYPNRGLEMADFDLQFSYPQDWTLVATGKPTAPVPERATNPANGAQTSRWDSDRRIPLAGFDLGKYRKVSTRAGNVLVETYATQGVERDFPNGRIQTIDPSPADPIGLRPPQVMVSPRPSPAQNEIGLGEAAARAIEYFSERFGPFPYSQLALTQMPGRDSQGWPGLVFFVVVCLSHQRAAAGAAL